MLDLSVRRRQGEFQIDATLRTEGGVTALFGRSGSGKTSLISMVAGLSRPDAGRIVVGDKVLFDSARGIDLPPERRQLGYVFQEGRLFPHLSVRSNLDFGLRRVPSALRTVNFDDVVAVLALAPLLGRQPATLSGGEKQRVAIGRALLASPRILLMDEPLAALDTARKAELLPFIAALARRIAIPILYVSHAMDEVLRLADTLALVEGGRVVAVGPVEELLSRPDLRPLTGHLDAGSVLRATVAAHDPAHGVTRLDFVGGTLVCGQLEHAVGTTVRVRVHARDIAIALDPPTRISVRNILSATVTRIAPTYGNGRTLDVLLDCGGSPLWAQITELAQAELNLRPGMPVHGLVKAVTISSADDVS